MTDNMGSYAQPGPGPREPYAQQDPGPQDQPSTTAVARDEAANVGRSAGEAGGHVAQTAADQAREVVSETARQARDLLGEASGHARDQASVQQQKAASQLRSVADELREMTVKGGQSGVATEVAQQAAERIHGVASWLEQREPADVLQAVRDFARRRPGVFLAGAVAAGLAAGRLTRGMTDAARSGGQQPGPAAAAARDTARCGDPAAARPGLDHSHARIPGRRRARRRRVRARDPPAQLPGPRGRSGAQRRQDGEEIPPGSFQGGAGTRAAAMRTAASRTAPRRPTGPGSSRDAAGPGPASQCDGRRNQPRRQPCLGRGTDRRGHPGYVDADAPGARPGQGRGQGGGGQGGAGRGHARRGRASPATWCCCSPPSRPGGGSPR